MPTQHSCAKMARHLAPWLAMLVAPAVATATPSTTFWAPSTPNVQPFGVLHVTYDTYFQSKAAHPIDTGLTLGVLPWKQLQLEVGFDVFYPTFSGTEVVDVPLVLNAKFGAPEDVYFRGQPAWSLGIFGVGFEENVTDQNVLHAMVGKTFPYVGSLQVGAYYALNKNLFRSSDGDDQRMGLMAGWFSPDIDVPRIDKIVFAWDIQTGRNKLGATGGGAYVYLTPSIDLATGPVFFFERELQPVGSSWMWSVQLDVNLDLFALKVLSIDLGTSDAVAQTVADAGLGAEQLGLRRVCFDLPAQLGHVDPQVMGMLDVAGPPDLLEDLTMGEDLPCVLREQDKEPIFDRCQPDFSTAQGHLASRKIDAQGSDLQNRSGRATGLLGVPQRHTNPGEKLIHSERLGEVVVRTSIERLDLICLPAAGRDDNDRGA